MSSLQEQLLKAGLVDQKKLARATQEKKRQANQSRKKNGKNRQKPKSPEQQARERKAQRDRELNRQRQEERRRKELSAQAAQLIDANRLDRAQGDQPYSFVYKRKVKKIYVTEAQKDQLAEGQIAIATCVKTDGRKFELVPTAVAEKIAERDAACVVDIARSQAAETDENDPYAQYQVPDDLVW